MNCPYCGHAHRVEQLCPTPTHRIDTLSFDGNLLAAKKEGDQRILEGIFLPYGEELARLDWLTGATRWVFEPESVELSDSPIAFYGHDHIMSGLPIGRLLAEEGEHRDDGYFGRMLLSETQKANDVYQLAKDRVLTRFSVGLDRMEATTRVEEPESPAPLLVWEKAPVWETSVVPRPAYDSARVESVLHRQETRERESITMKCSKCGQVHANGVTECDAAALAAQQTLSDPQRMTQLAEQVDQLGAGVERIERQLVTLGGGHAGGGSTPPVPVPGRSYGEFLQMLARADEDALAFLAYVERVLNGDEGPQAYLAFTGTVTGDIPDDWTSGTWVDDVIRPLQERRRVLNLFKTRPLPATGMNVDYGRVLDDSGVQVGEQVAQGDLLAYGKLAFDAGLSTPVRTFGGWGDMSKQVIQRSGAGVVDEFFRALINRYLQVTEAAVRLLAVNPANASVAQTTAANDLTTADGWIDFMVDSAFALDDAGLPLDFVLVSRTRFKSLAKLRDGEAADAPRLLDRNSGRVNITGLNGDVFGVQVVPLNIAGDYVRAGSGEAITTWESPGAPFRLQDEDITNLTEAFSLYGYLATASTNAKALIRPTEAGDVAP